MHSPAACTRAENMLMLCLWSFTKLMCCTLFVHTVATYVRIMARSKPSAQKKNSNPNPNCQVLGRGRHSKDIRVISATEQIPQAMPENTKVKRARWKKGTVSLREIRKMQKSVHFLVQKKPFQRLVREIAQDIKKHVCFQALALRFLQVRHLSRPR